MRTYDDATPLAGFSFPNPAQRPHIKANHVDGPLLVFSDGQMHWLTPWERILFWLGWTDAEKLQRKRRMYLTDFLQRQ